MRTQIRKTSLIKLVSSYLVPWLLCIAGLYYFCLGILGNDLQFIPGDLTDARFINYLLEHAHRWLSGQDKSFWTAGFMYPFSNNIALSDNMLGSAPLYSIWRWMGFTPETSFQGWWLAVCFFNYWSCYLVIRRLGHNVFIASIAAWIFAFSVFNIGQLSYLQLTVRYFIPPAFYAALRLVSSPSLRYLTLYLACLILQFLSVMYTGVYLFYFSLLFIGIYAWRSGKYKQLGYYLTKPRIWYSLGLALSALILLFVIVWPYQQMTGTVGLRLFREVTPHLPTLKSYLFPHEASIPWRFLHDTMRPVENDYWLHYVFPGMTLLFCLTLPAFYFLFKKRWKLNWAPECLAFLLTALVLALLHLRTENGFTLYALIFKLPGINSIRVPARFMHVELFLLVAAFAYLIQRLKTPALVLIALLVVADNLFNHDLVLRSTKQSWVERRENTANILNAQLRAQDTIFALINHQTSSFNCHLDAMIYAQQRGITTVNGYSSYCPDAFGEFFNSNSKAGLETWMHETKVPVKNVRLVILEGTLP